MKKKILIGLYVILILITLKLVINIQINSNLLDKYDNGEYDTNLAKRLTYFNYIQSYVAYYNYGNVFYQTGEYEKAIEEYKKALNGIVPKYKICDIRINYALAICQTVEIDESKENSIQDAIKTYESAIEILTQEGCANKINNNGHSQKAEQLKKDIQKEIERLKKIQPNEENSTEKEEESKEDKKKETYQTIEAKIQNIKEEATKDQREMESKFNNFNKDVNFKNKNW